MTSLCPEALAEAQRVLDRAAARLLRARLDAAVVVVREPEIAVSPDAGGDAADEQPPDHEEEP